MGRKNEYDTRSIPEQITSASVLKEHEKVLLLNYYNSLNLALEESQRENVSPAFNLYFDYLMAKTQEFLKEVERKKHYDSMNTLRREELTYPRNGGSYIYLVLDGNNKLFKIGLSKQIRLRLGQLETQSASGKKVRIVSFFPGDKKLEQYLHKRFISFRTHGEWFKPHKDIPDYFKQIAGERGGRFYTTRIDKYLGFDYRKT